jgi:hypothetical protein
MPNFNKQLCNFHLTMENIKQLESKSYCTGQVAIALQKCQSDEKESLTGRE